MVNIKHFCTVAFAFLENLLISGAFGGWVFITPALKEEGVYGHLCQVAKFNGTQNSSGVNTSNGTRSNCIEQKEIYNLVFTLATATATSGTLLAGFLFQTLGTWMCRLVAVAANAVGCLCMANVSAHQPALLFPGMICLALSGSFYYMTNMQFANLFAKARSTIIAFITGAFLSSSVMLWILSILYNAGVSLSMMFYILCSLSFLSLLDTFFLTAKSHIPFPVPEDFHYGLADFTKNTMSDCETRTQNGCESEENVVAEVRLLSVLKTGFYWVTIVQLTILHVCNEFFQSTFDTWLPSLASDQHEIETFTQVYGVFILVGGLVAAPATGLIFDLAKRYFARKFSDQKSADLQALLACSTFTSLSGVLFSGLLCTRNLGLQYFTLVLYVFFRVALYSNGTISLATFYPPRKMATLLGMGMVVSAVCSLLRYPMLSLVLRIFGGNFSYMYAICLLFCLLSFVQPAYVYRLIAISENPVETQTPHS